MHLTLTYELWPAERAQGQRRLRGRWPSLWWVVGGFTLLGAVGLTLGPWARDSALLLLGAAALYTVLLTVATLRARARARARRGAAGPNVRLELTVVGIVLSTGTSRHELPWDAVAAIEETADTVLLRNGRRTAVIVPKRAFGDAGLETFRRFAAGHRACGAIAGTGTD